MGVPNIRGRALPGAVLLLLGSAIAGCSYGFQGGGGLPPHINTIFVEPVGNETTRFVLSERITQGLLEAVRGRLGAQVASREAADAILRVTATDYEDEALNIGAREDVGAEVFQRRVTITAQVEFMDLTRQEMLWSSGSVRATGEYAPREESEDVGLDLAVENMIQQIVNGAQSQW